LRRDGLLEQTRSLGKVGFFDSCAHETLGGCRRAQRCCAATANDNGDAAAHAFIVKQRLDGGSDQGKIAASYAQLQKAGPHSAGLAPNGQSDGRQTFIERQSCRHCATEKIGAGDDAFRFRAAAEDFAIERQRGHADLRDGVGIGEASPDGPAIARLGVPDMVKRLGEKRCLFANNIARERVRLSGARLYGDGPIAKFDAAQIRNAIDVNQKRGPREAHRQERNQGLPAGDDPALAICAGEQPAGFKPALTGDPAHGYAMHASRGRLTADLRVPLDDVAAAIKDGAVPADLLVT
jgi:hypothetical protein